MDTEFAEIIAKIEKRRAELQAAVTAAARDKKYVLEEQHSLIEAEKTKVERECEGLQYQVETNKKYIDITLLLARIILHYEISSDRSRSGILLNVLTACQISLMQRLLSANPRRMLLLHSNLIIMTLSPN